MKNSRRLFAGMLFIFTLVALLGLCFYSPIYDSMENWSGTEIGSEHYFRRDIGTNLELLLNGYLGIFFRFKYFGLLNWLSIPVFAYFLVTIRKREKGQFALCIALFLSTVFIGIKGYANYRYQSTLFPVLITINCLLIWEVFQKSGPKVKIFMISTGCLLLLINFHYLSDSYFISNLKAWTSSKSFPFPYKIIRYLNERIDPNDVILECNQPILYYYTDKKGISVNNVNLHAVYRNTADISRGYPILKNDLGVKYILTDTVYESLLQHNTIERYFKIFKMINCELLYSENGYKLYKLRNNPYSLSMTSFSERQPFLSINEFHYNASEKLITSDKTKTRNESTIKIQGVRGDFYFIPTDKGKLHVTLKKPDQDVQPVLQFGFIHETQLGLKDNDLVSVIARVRTNSPESRTVLLFIQDKTKKWIREKTDMYGPEWRDYLVVHKMRRGFTHMNIGFYWEPESTDEWLDIESFRIYIRGRNEPISNDVLKKSSSLSYSPNPI